MEERRRVSCSLAIPFAINNKYNDVADEFNIVFRQSYDDSLAKLIEFIELYPDKRINLEMDTFNIDICNIINRRHPNFYIKLKYNNLRFRDKKSVPKIINLLQENNIRYYFSDFVKNVEELELFTKTLGAWEFYIAGDLLYRLPDVREYCDENGIGIRFIPNLAYAMRIEECTNPRTFYIPPDCFSYFEHYFDSIEFNMMRRYNWQEFGVYYRAWIEKERWHGDLREIIHNLGIRIPNDQFDGLDLLRFKIMCGRKCSIQPHCKCRKCESFLELAYDLEEEDLFIEKGKTE